MNELLVKSGAERTSVGTRQDPEQVAGMVLLDAQPPDAFANLPGYTSFYDGFRRAAGLFHPSRGWA
jgi:hypothetical protein